jgi:hypothetical protein
MVNEYLKESLEFQAVPVTLNGVVVTTGIQYSVVTYGSDPSTFTNASTLSGQTGFYVGSYAPGNWHVYAKITSSPEVPVIDCGDFVILSR